MTTLPAARKDDPIEHESLFSQICQVGAGFATGLAVGLAFGLAAAFVVGTGGLGAIVLGAVVAAGMEFGADKLLHAAGVPGPGDLPGLASEGAGWLADKAVPPSIAGQIADGSPNVLINGRPAARALPGPGDDNPVKCDRHSGVQHVAEGSKIVLINGAPANRKGDHIDCNAKTAKGSTNVLVGGPPEATREIKSDIPWWLNALSFVAGIALVLCDHDWKSVGKLACLGVGMAVSALTSWGLKATFGNPVHAPTGAKFLDGSDDLDFELPARLPLRWVRTYNSLDEAEGPLGQGWRLPVTLTLTATEDGATLTDARGIEIPFGPIEPRHAVVNILHGWTLGRAGGRWLAEDPEGRIHDFGPDRYGEALPLLRIEDRNGNFIALRHDEEGRLVEMADSTGRRYVCAYDADHPRRIAEVAWLTEAEAPITLVRYGYDRNGRLASVADRAGAVVRQFTWHDSGLMASHTLPSGLVSHYEWSRFAGSHPRVTRQWNSLGEEWRADYRLAADGKSGATLVIDHLGRRQSWEWTGPFQITAYRDAEDQVWRWTYDSNNLPLTCTEPDGAAWSHRYDARGNLVEATDPLGGKYLTEWRDDRPLPARETAPDGAETRYEYDPRGNLAAVEHPGGRIELVRDDGGAVVARRDERGGLNRWRRRADGQAASFTDCSGKTTRWDYDGEGRLTIETDAAGQATRYGWDAAGRPAARLNPDGVSFFWRWRPGGTLASSEVSGAVTRYEWDAAGRLTAKTDPEGNRVSREFDAGGRITLLTDGAGQETRFAYDRVDRLVAETGIDGIRSDYRLDPRGLPVMVTRIAEDGGRTVISLERDPMSRLVAKGTGESLTRYEYDPVGRVTAVRRFATDGETPVDSIGFAYDDAGRLIEETAEVQRLGRLNGSSWRWEALSEPRRTAIRHERNEVGHIVATALPYGPELRYLRYGGAGHLLQINLGDVELTEMERDDLHREIGRGQGALKTRFDLDPMGRRLTCRTDLADASFGAGAKLAKDYRYDARGLLAARQDRWMGERRFAYDDADRVVASQIDGFDEAFQWDGASNALPHQAGLRVIEGETVRNRVLRWGDCVYDYDAKGRLVRKKTASGERLFFSWNDENQMVASASRAGEWSYHYDALGRRIAKRRHDGARPPDTTWFVWDGMRMAQEEHGQRCVTTVYADVGSYVPLARVEHGSWEKTITAGQIYYFHTDINGAPEELTSHAGKVAWRARYLTWGNLAQEEWDREYEWDAGLQRREQNLRFQGQYYDAETGLHYNTFRYYDPEIGRFVSQDPIGLAGGMNLYRYAPNPIHWIDPWGWCSTKLGKNMGARAGDEMANHHLVPEELIKDPEFAAMFSRLKKMGWNPDGAPNGVFLPGNESMAEATGMPGHWSNHPEYTDAVRGQVEKLNNMAPNLSDTQLALGMGNIQSNARSGLMSGAFPTNSVGRLQ